MKVCQVIFSSNRIEYLMRTLRANRNNLNFEGCNVHKIFIDDYPEGRDDFFIRGLVEMYGFNEIHLHGENRGLSVTWTEFWNLIRDRDFDYVFHQEDDVEILYPVKVMDLISLLQQDLSLSQVVLKRQKWYEEEPETVALPDDWTFHLSDYHYRYEKKSLIFSPMASLYSIERVKFNLKQWLENNYPETNLSSVNLNEGLIGKTFHECSGLVSGHLKHASGKNLINHIGDYFVGKRVLPGEPNYERFECFDPLKRYNSRTGSEY